MSTCKDCVHYEPCRDTYYNNEEQTRIPFGLLEKDGVDKDCAFFKDRSKFIELPNVLKKGDKLYYICEDTVEKKDVVGELPDIVTAVMAEGFFTSPRTDSDGTFYPSCDQFYYWNAIGCEYFLTKEEAEKALKEQSDD